MCPIDPPASRSDPGFERELDRDVAGAASAHQRLLARLDAILGDNDLDLRSPTRRPGWSVDDLLASLRDHSERVLRALDGLDEPPERGPADQTAANHIAPHQTAAERVAEVRRAIWQLETRWAAPVDWPGQLRDRRGARVAIRELPFRQWREVELHHLDLDLGYEFEDLPTDFVRLELRRAEMAWNARRPMGMTGLPAEALAAAPARRLAWLLGRGSIPGLAPVDPG